MIEPGWPSGEADVKALRTLADAILPGDGNRWPSASNAIDDPRRILREVPADEAEWLAALARELAQLPPHSRIEAARAEEARSPARFARAVQAVYRVYYTSAPVLAVVAALADEGPREPSPVFDETLVAKVKATQAGQRRL